MAKVKTEFVCTNCRHVVAKWQGRCDQCGEWNTYEERVQESKQSTGFAGARKKTSGDSKPVRLNTIKVEKNNRIDTLNPELNRVLGGGIVPDSVNVVSAPPGMGKSTLLLKTANDLGNSGHKVLYASGEESSTQIKSRADRICGGKISDNLYVMSETSMSKIESYIEEVDPVLVIVDSIQKVYMEDIPSRIGTPTQVNECTDRLIDIAKHGNKPISCIIVGQMTKEDELAGSRTFEHAVDAVLYLEGDRNEQLRTLRAIKNRFGDTEETGLFQMEEHGLIPIDNPSKFFITERDEPVAGSALTVTKEGSRNIVVEVESLVSKSYYGFPSRMSNGIRKELLQILVEILEQRGGLSCSDKNVTVMVTGGLKLTEPSVNLGILMSIASSLYDKAIPSGTIFMGEVGLTGEIKQVRSLEPRIKEIDRMGFEKVYVPKGSLKNKLLTKTTKIIEVPTLRSAIESVFGTVEKRRVKSQ